VLGLACAAQAAPLDIKQVPAGATWVVHVDVDAIRASTVAQKAYAQCLEKHKDRVEVALELIKRTVGMDLCKDLHGLTAYGPKVGQEKGVLLVFANFDQQMLGKLVKLAPDFKTTKHGQYTIGSWTHKDRRGPRPAAGAFWKPGVTVLSGTVPDVELALDVLDGKKPSLPGKVEIPAGATVAARAWGLANVELPGKCPLPKQIEEFCFAMGENEGQSFLMAQVKTKSPDVAQDIAKIIEGGKALAGLRHLGDAAAAKIIDQFKVSASDNTVKIDFHAPAADVWAHLQKVIKDVKHMHGHHAKPPAKHEGKK
jgi:hypothetical protein